MRASSAGARPQLRARRVHDKLRHMAGNSAGLGSLTLLIALASACSGKSVTPAGDTSGADPAQSELPCLGTDDQPRTLFGDYQTGFAVAGDQVVIAAEDGIRRMPIAGGDSVLLASASDPSGPLVLNGNVYFTEEQPIGEPVGGKQSTAPALEVVPVAGGDVTTVVATGAALFENTAVDASSLYLDQVATGILKFTPPNTTTTLPLMTTVLVGGIAAHGDYVYVAAQTFAAGSTAGTILRLPKNGGSADTLVANIGQPSNLVVDDSGLYWAEGPPVGTFGAGHIARANLDGSNVTTLVPNTTATSLALHAGRLYFSTASGIASIPTTGGTVVTLVAGQKSAGALAVAGQNLLWIDPAERALSDSTVPAVLTACIPPEN